MNLTVEKTNGIRGTVTPPSSKSHSVRALLLATMTNGVSELTNILDSDDTAAALDTVKRLGTKVRVNKNQNGGLDVELESGGAPLQTGATDLYTGNSGITTRFVLPLLGLRADTTQPIVLDCGEQMKQRPLQPLIDALNRLGIRIESVNKSGTCPLKISGRLVGGQATVDGITSQYISALLLSLPLASQDSKISVVNLHELPYVEMTMRWLDEQKIKYEWHSPNCHSERGLAGGEESLPQSSHKELLSEPVILRPELLGTQDDKTVDVFRIFGHQSYRPFKKTIPGDFTSASYLLIAATMIPDEVEVRGLDLNDPQGDKKLVEILQQMDADIKIESEKIIIRGGKKLHGLKIDCNEIPDLVPTLAVLGTVAVGKTELVNVPQARLKETDRLHSMAEGLIKLGARVEEKPDGLVIYESKLHGAEVKGYDDHRTVMALALAGMLAEGTTIIDTAEAINKTFPGFVSTMNMIGGKMLIQ